MCNLSVLNSMLTSLDKDRKVELELLSKEAKRLGIDMNNTAREVSEILMELGKIGFSDNLK